MNEVLLEAENVIAPVLNGAGPGAKNRIACVSVTTSSARTDLSTLLSDWAAGHFITICPEADVYIAFNNADSGTVDETATSGATVCWLIPAKSYFHVRMVKNYSWLIVKGTSACKLRAYISSCMSQDAVL